MGVDFYYCPECEECLNSEGMIHCNDGWHWVCYRCSNMNEMDEKWCELEKKNKDNKDFNDDWRSDMGKVLDPAWRCDYCERK